MFVWIRGAVDIAGLKSTETITLLLCNIKMSEMFTIRWAVLFLVLHALFIASVIILQLEFESNKGKDQTILLLIFTTTKLPSFHTECVLDLRLLLL